MPNTSSNLSIHSRLEKPPHLGAQRTPAGSFWSHDSSEESTDGHGPLRAVLTSESCAPFKRLLSNRKIVIIGSIALFLITVGSIVGGVFAIRAAKNKASVQASDQHEHEGAGPIQVLVNKGSQLASLFTHSPTPSREERILIFQESDGDFVATEWQENSAESYRLHKHSNGLPRPLLGSPFQPVSFGKNGELHAFYVDEKRLLRHLIRTVGQDANAEWHLDPTFSDDGQQRHEVSDFSLSATVFPAMDRGDSDGVLGVLFRSPSSEDALTLLTTSQPGMNTPWGSMSIPFSPNPEQKAQRMQHDTSGLLLVPTTMIFLDGQLGPGVRVIWDRSNEDREASLGFVDCALDRKDLARDCQSSEILWHDAKDYEQLLSARKPLRISKIDIRRNIWGMPINYLLAVLDSAGHYMEMFWDGNEWASAKQFMAAELLGSGDAFSPTGMVPTESGLVFAAPNGTLVQVERECEWWLGSCKTGAWSFAGMLNVTVEG